MLPGILLLAVTLGLVICVFFFGEDKPRQTLDISVTHFIHLI